MTRALRGTDAAWSRTSEYFPLRRQPEGDMRMVRYKFVCSHRRCDLIDELKWACGTAGLPPDAKSKLSSAEQDYFNGYGNLITAYIAATGVDIMSVGGRGARRGCALSICTGSSPLVSSIIVCC